MYKHCSAFNVAAWISVYNTHNIMGLLGCPIIIIYISVKIVDKSVFLEAI